MKAIISSLPDFYKRFEKYISPIGLIYGFIFTSLTLTRVDNFLENFWIIVHLLIAALGILAVTLYENKAEKKEIPELDREKFRFYFTLIIQFAFGNLFATFFVFYIRSSSLAQSWIFLLILAILLVGNELWKKHYTRLTFQVSILFFSIFLFLIFIFPVIFHRLGSDLFIASGLVSLLIITIFLFLLKKISHEKFKNSHNSLSFSIIIIFLTTNILYFTNIIPPIPLSLKNSGVYHKVVKNIQGNYEVQAEPTTWRDYFTRYPVFHAQNNSEAYVFSAIFSPVKFATEVVHQWQYYDEEKKAWIDSGRIVLPILGGREEGFRTYSLRENLVAGLWRVKVVTTQGRVIGKVSFQVKNSVYPHNLIEKIL